MRRRNFLKISAALLIATQTVGKSIAAGLAAIKSNFNFVYGNMRLKNNFYLFLKNVFHLYPEDKMHELIAKTTKSYPDDQQIYLTAQKGLGDISPFFSIFKYQLPALIKQKDEMARQTVALIGEDTKYNGYLEIGSSGRYLDYLEEKVKISGERYYADGKEPGYGITSMIDRGQIAIGAEYIPMADYKTRYADLIPAQSLDLVTVYIGFHHCPIELRKPFISSIRDTMRPGGKLVLRDHDCHSPEQETIVALAHDVFNMGTNETWEYNNSEIRNFYSLDFIIDFVSDIGFKFEGQTLYQDGDPTKNALMLFTKLY